MDYLAFDANYAVNEIIKVTDNFRQIMELFPDQAVFNTF